MTVVFDSGIWISAFQFGGIPLAALDYAFVHAEIAICPPIISEVSSILVAKFGWTEADIMSVLHNYLLEATRVSIRGEIQNACRDPKDNMVLECAVLANAEIIVSGDKDLLDLKQFEQISILTPRQYLYNR